jgi:hypothetical protein
VRHLPTCPRHWLPLHLIVKYSPRYSAQRVSLWFQWNYQQPGDGNTSKESVTPLQSDSITASFSDQGFWRIFYPVLAVYFSKEIRRIIISSTFVISPISSQDVVFCSPFRQSLVVFFSLWLAMRRGSTRAPSLAVPDNYVRNERCRKEPLDGSACKDRSFEKKIPDTALSSPEWRMVVNQSQPSDVLT